MENKKVSLVKDVFKANIVKKDSKIQIVKDERIISENNKIMNITFNILVCILVLISIIMDTINIDINSNIIFISVGVVSYIGLILMCKNNSIEGNESAGIFFIWSIFTLPISIFNYIDDILYKFVNKKSFFIIEICISIILVVILYQIANGIYRKISKNTQG